MEGTIYKIVVVRPSYSELEHAQLKLMYIAQGICLIMIDIHCHRSQQQLVAIARRLS